MNNGGLKMGNIIKKVPVPIAGLMLALAATGNLVLSYGSIYRNIFGVLSAIIALLLIAKIFTDFKSISKALTNPVMASVAPTFSMGIMILSTYIKPYSVVVGKSVWVLGLIIHCFLILMFTRKFIFKFNINKVFASYFVVYVGIVVGSVTAPAYGLFAIGKSLFWFGFISYLILLPIVLYRVLVIKGIKEPVIPTITIIAAPASLCLAGYMSSFGNKNMLMVNFLTVLALIMTFSVLLYMPKMLKLKFYPSYSAFTFPFVISAIAIKKTNAFLNSSGNGIGILKYIVKFEELFTVFIVLYVLIRYTKFLLSSPKEKLKVN